MSTIRWLRMSEGLAALGHQVDMIMNGDGIVASKNCGNWELCNEQLLVSEYTADAFAEAIRCARAEKFADHMDLFLDRSSYQSLKEVLFERQHHSAVSLSPSAPRFVTD